MTQNKDRPMEKSEWLRICANRLIEKAEITEKAATEIAEGLFDNAIFYDNPEADADEELSYWTE